jgi:hypothetical protein
LTSADGLKQRVCNSLGFVNDHQQWMEFMVLGVPTFSPSWVGG